MGSTPHHPAASGLQVADGAHHPHRGRRLRGRLPHRSGLRIECRGGHDPGGGEHVGDELPRDHALLLSIQVHGVFPPRQKSGDIHSSSCHAGRVSGGSNGWSGGRIQRTPL